MPIAGVCATAVAFLTGAVNRPLSQQPQFLPGAVMDNASIAAPLPSFYVDHPLPLH